jgi:hypothetical protein
MMRDALSLVSSYVVYSMTGPMKVRRGLVRDLYPTRYARKIQTVVITSGQEPYLGGDDRREEGLLRHDEAGDEEDQLPTSPPTHTRLSLLPVPHTPLPLHKHKHTRTEATPVHIPHAPCCRCTRPSARRSAATARRWPRCAPGRRTTCTDPRTPEPPPTTTTTRQHTPSIRSASGSGARKALIRTGIDQLAWHQWSPAIPCGRALECRGPD